ncbi:MAG: hypothetical protein HGA44_16965 [Cellulomonadaceae bacterium]|nr:hypothetical protein [Cellulomonadaceae bacterium]
MERHTVDRADQADDVVARRGEPELTTTILTDAQVRDLVERMLKVSGRRLDLSKPTTWLTFDLRHFPHGGRVFAQVRALQSCQFPAWEA